MLGLGNSVSVPYTKIWWDYYSMKFDGADQYLDGDALATQFNKDAGTVSCWIIQPITGTTTMMFGLRVDSNNFIQMFYHAGSNAFRATYKGGGTSTALATTAVSIENSGNWHHVAFTWDTSADEAKLWIDGAVRDTETSLPTISGTFSTFDIGQNTNNGGYFNGSMNDFAMWTDVQDVARIYNTPFGTTGAGLPNDETQFKPNIYLTFEEGDGTSAINYGSSAPTNVRLTNDPEWLKSTPTNPA